MKHRKIITATLMTLVLTTIFLGNVKMFSLVKSNLQTIVFDNNLENKAPITPPINLNANFVTHQDRQASIQFKVY